MIVVCSSTYDFKSCQAIHCVVIKKQCFVTSSFSPFIPYTVCKILVNELHDRLEDSGKKKEVLRLGQGLDQAKKKAVNYEKS